MKKSSLIAIIVLVAAVVIIAIIGFSSQTSAPSVPGTQSSSTNNAPSGLSSGTSTPLIQTSTVTYESQGVENPTSTTWTSYTSASVKISFRYPPGWSLGPNTPISFDNFEHHYNGNAIPAGGAEIDIANTNYFGSLSDLIKTEANGAPYTTKTVSVGGISCTESSYGGSYDAAHQSNNVSVYCPDAAAGNGLLYKIYLSYPAGDAKGSQNLATFDQVLASITFAK